MSEDLSTLNLVELLEQLEPLEDPVPISMLPQTEAWAWIGAGLALVLGLFVLRAYQRWRANAYRRAALEELAAAGENPAAIAQILRRTALSAFPREKVASLHGEDWLAFLNTTCPTIEFQNNEGRALCRAAYAPEVEATQVRSLAEAWIRNHRASRT